MEKKIKDNNIYITWIKVTAMLILISICMFALFTIYIDPFFHYHKPLQNYEYPINNERYQNDGITRNFEYDGIITGNSMTENFRVSEANEIFNADFIKVPFQGGFYKEVNDNLQRAYEAGKDIRFVVRCLDYNCLIKDKDADNGYSFPTYLYNSNPFDDVNYVLNKSVFLGQTINVIEYTESGKETTNFDEYANWNDRFTFGREAVLASYKVGEEKNERILSETEVMMVYGNIHQNVTDLADLHPETTFYLFFSPYSICYWDILNNSGEIDWRIDAEQIAIEEMLKHPNIKLFSFCDDFELVCNLDNYKDHIHYGEWVNSWILKWMRDDEHLLTEENYKEYIETIREFYHSYDYSLLRE